MPCTAKKTLHQIVKQGNDYLVCVKANQQRLYRGIEQQSKMNQPLSCYQEHEQGHGRSTNWQVSVFDGVAAFGHECPGIQSCIVAQRHGHRDGKSFDERQYYISSVVTNAEQFHRIVRGIGALKTNCIGSKMSRSTKTMHRSQVDMQQRIGQWYATSSSAWLGQSALLQWQLQSDSWRISSSEYFLSYNETALPHRVVV